MWLGVWPFLLTLYVLWFESLECNVKGRKSPVASCLRCLRGSTAGSVAMLPRRARVCHSCVLCHADMLLLIATLTFRHSARISVQQLL